VAEKLIAEALDDHEAEDKALHLGAAHLDELGIDADDLGLSLAHLGLQATPNFDGQGGFLIARSPDVLEQAEGLTNQHQSVPIISLNQKHKRGRQRVAAHARRTAPDGPGVPSSIAVKPLDPVLEEARRDRARRHLQEFRTARNFENCDRAGRLEKSR
jgi:hypothetical protein